MKKRSRWNELLDVPEEIRHPNLYQILGLDEQRFAVDQVEPAFRVRMQKVQSLRSTKHKEFLEFVKGELRRGLRVLTSTEQRRGYDAELREERVAELRRILVPTLAAGVLVGAAEKALLGAAVLDLGMSEPEALEVIEDELVRTGAVRVDAPTLGAIPAHEGLTAEATAELAKVQAESMARLAEAAALRALEMMRLAEGSTAHGPPIPLDVPSDESVDGSSDAVIVPLPDDIEVEVATPRRKKKKSSAVKRKTKKSERIAKVSLAAPPTAAKPAAAKPSLVTAAPAQKFCASCGVSIPEHWRKSGEAERVGARLLCSKCTGPIRAGKACAGCSRPLGPQDKAISAGGAKRICSRCALGAQRLKVCASCGLILPRSVVERGEVVERGGKFLCKDCAG
ncbi:MAG: hypothetical protein ACAI25_02645 [Planctomycetota bacterium]